MAKDEGVERPPSIERLIVELRPRLHKYCARMVGSVVDGEDVVQEALLKAIEAIAGHSDVANPERWLIRIAHNAAIDFLRRRTRDAARHEGTDKDLEMIADPGAAADRSQIAAASLRSFIRLPVPQRSSVVLMDVLGYSLQEIEGMTGMTIPAIKAALHRGRVRLREISGEPDDYIPPSLSEADRTRLAAYASRFNARDFVAVREMLTEEVRLEMVATARLTGRDRVTEAYFGNYGRRRDWQLAPGVVDGRPAVLVMDGTDLSEKPVYFILLEWRDSLITKIRDFSHARYAIDGAQILLDQGSL
ncbi:MULTISPECIES: sigma-70 family RNA polymerase sigma factor [unclassified Bradyrhizobium]|uniref:sigma-70 family RNA polymerase sigma factor n=1 Tax=unclassified Bradyrhizobium TaxID=2631580 RepID=UPI0028E4AF14|nr:MULTISPECIES: sigma-70 family RNA polymerase sigma factor [unclassified Bradyrhizobium]